MTPSLSRLRISPESHEANMNNVSSHPKSGDTFSIHELAYAELNDLYQHQQQQQEQQQKKRQDQKESTNLHSGDDYTDKIAAVRRKSGTDIENTTLSNEVSNSPPPSTSRSSPPSRSKSVSNTDEAASTLSKPNVLPEAIITPTASWTPCSFPMACRTLLHELPGNSNCVDCGASGPEWACVLYGTLVCINCSGKHRALGVATSKVASVTMDHWTYPDIIKMLEGGNSQLSTFFTRHQLCQSTIGKTHGTDRNGDGATTPTTTKMTSGSFKEKEEPSQSKTPTILNASSSSSPSPSSTSNHVSLATSVGLLSTSSSSSPSSSLQRPSTPSSSNPSTQSSHTAAISGTATGSSSSSSSSSTSSSITKSNVSTMRYKTKAALFYRQQLDQHTVALVSSGPYQGRRRRPGRPNPKRRPLGHSTSTCN